MRSFILTWLIFLIAQHAGAENVTVWIGMQTPTDGATEGIYRSTLDTETGALAKPKLATELAAPGFLALHPEGKRLYSICRLPNDGGGGVAGFEIDGENLRAINSQPTGDGEACHLALDPTARCLFSAQ